MSLTMKEKKILIVDFDNETSENLSKYLIGEGFEVSVAKDGQSGQEKFQSERPDLIVLEPMLPKVHGFDLCKNLFQNARRKIPIVFTTEFYGEEQCKRETTYSDQEMAFFKKPYNGDEVLSSILDLLGNGAKEMAEDRTASEEPEITDDADAVDASPGPKQVKAPQDEMMNLSPASPPALEIETAEEQKKSELPEDIDRMLKDTLSEFGMSDKTDEAKPLSDTSPPESPPQPQDTSLSKEQEKTEAERETIEKPSTASVESASVIEAPEEKDKRPGLIDETEGQQDFEDSPEKGMFAGFAEEKEVDRKTLSEKFIAVLSLIKKKPALKYILPLVLVCLIAAGAALIILLPKKAGAPPSGNLSQFDPSSAKNAEGTQLANLSSVLLPSLGETEDNSSPESPASPNTSDELSQTDPGAASPETQMNAKVETPASSEPETPPTTNPPPPPTTLAPELTEPVLPEASVYQELDINPEITAKSDQLDKAEKPGSAGEVIPPQAENMNTNPATPQNLPAQIKTGDIVALNTVDTPPILIRRIQPRYPPSALSQDIEEDVLVNALISENGVVEKTVVLKGGNPQFGFDEATTKAVSQWRFKPAVKDGVKVKVWKPIKIAFKKNK